jgi:hypothetical protein
MLRKSKTSLPGSNSQYDNAKNLADAGLARRAHSGMWELLLVSMAFSRMLDS